MLFQIFMEPAEDWVKEVRRQTLEIKLHGRLPGLFIQGQPLIQIIIIF